MFCSYWLSWILQNLNPNFLFTGQGGVYVANQSVLSQTEGGDDSSRIIRFRRNVPNDPNVPNVPKIRSASFLSIIQQFLKEKLEQNALQKKRIFFFSKLGWPFTANQIEIRPDHHRLFGYNLLN